MSATKKGLVTRGPPGGGLVTEMDPRDGVRKMPSFACAILDFFFLYRYVSHC